MNPKAFYNAPNARLCCEVILGARLAAYPKQILIQLVTLGSLRLNIHQETVNQTLGAEGVALSRAPDLYRTTGAGVRANDAYLPALDPLPSPA